MWGQVAGFFGKGGSARKGLSTAASWYMKKIMGTPSNAASNYMAGTSWGKGYEHLGGGFVRGAITGALYSGGTAAFDKDRRVLSGAIKGAFWGGLAGVGGAAGRKTLMGAGPEYAQHARRLGARRAAASVVGTYGVGAWFFGKSKKRKHYSRFHHGEVRR